MAGDSGNKHVTAEGGGLATGGGDSDDYQTYLGVVCVVMVITVESYFYADGM